MAYHKNEALPAPSQVTGRNKYIVQVCVWDEATNEVVMARWQGGQWMYDSQVKRCQDYLNWWDYAPDFSKQQQE